MSFDNYNCDYNNQNHQTDCAQQPTSVVVKPVNALAIVEGKPRWSWALTITSVATAIFCSCLFGSLGVLQAVHAYIDHKAGDYIHARTKRNIGWGFTIAGLVIGSVLWIIILLIWERFTRMIR